MNRLAIEYPEDFVLFIKEFLYQNFPQKPTTEDCIQDIQAMVNQLTNPTNSALYSQLTNPALNDQNSVCLVSYNSLGFVDKSFDNFFDQSEVLTECFNESCDSYFDGIPSSIMEDTGFNI